jgi:23S rRNA pseudouridine1911/1915/1917 synthase
VELRVDSQGAGERLDRWLAEHLGDHSRSEIQRWIREGGVTVGGIAGRASQRVVEGDLVVVVVEAATAPLDLLPEPLELPVIYEDADVLVVNKPSGMVVHPAPGHQAGTLVNAVLYLCPDLAGVGGERRPGIVHRLDKETSGVMVVAKHDRALRSLQQQFKSRSVHKEYLALLEGVPASTRGRIDAPLGRHPADRKRQAAQPPTPGTALRRIREAVTEYVVEAVFASVVRNDQGRANFSLVRAHPITGRTHQIRVHFAWLGHPIVGDRLYGLKHQRLAVERMFLHAARLRFALPSTGEMRDFSAPLPDDLQCVLDRLERAAPRGS